MSLPKSLLDDFDKVLADRGYHSRSKGIRDALNDYILRYKWMKEIEGERVGIVSVMYDHHYTGVMEKVADAQHEFKDYINATMHVHLTDNYCLEVIVVNGDVSKIRDLTEKMMRLKGVENVRLISTPTTDSLSHYHDDFDDEI